MNYARAIINKLGGPCSLARDLGKAYSTVISWQLRGSIPDKHKAAVKRVADAKGVQLTASDFFPGAGLGGVVQKEESAIEV